MNCLQIPPYASGTNSVLVVAQCVFFADVMIPEVLASERFHNHTVHLASQNDAASISATKLSFFPSTLGPDSLGSIQPLWLLQYLALA